MKLYFKNSEGKERLLCTAKTKDEVNNAISKFLDDNNYKCHYQRIWGHDGRIWIDFGSWSEFFVIDDADINELMGL